MRRFGMPAKITRLLEGQLTSTCLLDVGKRALNGPADLPDRCLLSEEVEAGAALRW
jgi:hypothetical protein